MILPSIEFCPGTLAGGFSKYSTTCLRRVFDGRSVSHVLPYDSPSSDEKSQGMFAENRKRMSISGVQDKISLKFGSNGELEPTAENVLVICG